MTKQANINALAAPTSNLGTVKMGEGGGLSNIHNLSLSLDPSFARLCAIFSSLLCYMGFKRHTVKQNWKQNKPR